MSAIDDQIDALKFGVEKSISYTTKRRSFFEELSNTKTILSTFSGLSIFVVLLKSYDSAAQLIAGFLAFINCIDLVVCFSRRANVYDALQRRFSDLLGKIIQEPHTQANYQMWCAERLTIEKDEPAKYKALEQVCYNELVTLRDQADHLTKIPWLKMQLKNFLRYDDWTPEPALAKNNTGNNTK